MATPGRKYHLSDQFKAEAATAPIIVLEAVEDQTIWVTHLYCFE